ncbi:MAG: crosslink repair DNA glycosylase YcaQ family protein, partial [Nocardioides sp.]|nr:crosslink repair DNA glycosylase YcaQ family protein [Nocardioides sp.]
MRHITDTERRARLARRHAVAPAHRVADPEAATHAMTVLHATEAPTVYLSLLARVDGITVADVDRALYDDRTLVKQVAMRRTQFVFPRDLLPAAWASAAARVAAGHGTRLAKEAVGAGLTDDGAAWLDQAREATLTHLADLGGGAELTAGELRAQVPALAG